MLFCNRYYYTKLVGVWVSKSINNLTLYNDLDKSGIKSLESVSILQLFPGLDVYRYLIWLEAKLIHWPQLWSKPHRVLSIDQSLKNSLYLFALWN
jgi:hypothetical protein